MSYYSKNAKKKLVIYQHGLGDNQERLKPLADNIVNFNSSLNKRFSTEIDMTEYDETNNYLKNEIQCNIDKLIEFCDRNTNSNIHILTYLGSIDSIEMQKNRLIALINYVEANIKNKREIVLIGHSRGGLTNLEVAIAMPSKISQLISLNTPYAKNSLACGVNFLANIAKYASNHKLLHLFTNPEQSSNINQDSENLINGINKIKNMVSELSSDEYYNSLKKRWNALTTKPELHVIGSASAINHGITGIGVTPARRFTDILVYLNDQIDIKADSIKCYLPNGCPCDKYLLEEDIDKFNLECYTCAKDCALIEINTTKILIDSVLDTIDLFCNTKSIKDLDSDSVKLIKTYCAILDDSIAFDIQDEEYMALYKAANHICSHKLLMTSNLCACYIKGLIS